MIVSELRERGPMPAVSWLAPRTDTSLILVKVARQRVGGRDSAKATGKQEK